MSSPAPSLPLLTVPPRQKHPKSAPIGIAAGAEDAKYHAKYKELKRKVKDIEADNDKLHFKVLQAKLSIRRTKMERAVLYERLSVVPPSPNVQDRLALPSNAGPPHPSSSRPLIRDHHPMDLDHSHIGSLHQGNNNNKGLPIMDNAASSVALNSPRRISAPGPHHHPYPPPQQQQHMPPMGQIPPVHHRHHSYERHPSHASPPVHHASTSHSRTRSQSSSRSRSQHHHQAPPQQYPQGGQQQHHYPEALPPVQQPLHSPPLSERERPRRGEHQQQLYPHDYLGGSSHADPHHHSVGPYDYDQRHPGGSSTNSHLHSPRASSRIHAHQRLGPGTYVNSRDEYSRGHHEGARDLIAREREHDLILERERERELDRDPRDIDREYRDQDRRYNRSSRETNLHPSATQHSPPHSSSSHHHISTHQHRYSDRSGVQVDYAHEYPHGHAHTSSRSRGGDRDDPPYRDYRDGTPTLAHAPYPPPTRPSRSGTPGSGSAASGSGGAPPAEGPSRPASRSQYYGDSREREYPSAANRSSYNRQVRSGGRGGEDDADFDADGHAGDGRSSRGDHTGPTTATGPPTPSGGGVNNNNDHHSAASVGGNNTISVPESRKRSRNDMEVDSDNDVGADGQPSAGERGTALYGSRQQDDSRGSKRYHREHRRSVDNISTQEDTRMGPS